MTITLIVVGLMLLLLAGVALSSFLSDPKDIENEEAAAVEHETPEERREFLRKADAVPPAVSDEFSKGEPGGEDVSSI